MTQKQRDVNFFSYENDLCASLKQLSKEDKQNGKAIITAIPS